MTKPIISENVKFCKSCETYKPKTLEYFNKKLDGLASRCKECTKAAKKLDWQKNKDIYNAKRRTEEYRAKERIRERERYAAFPDDKKIRSKAWRLQNIEHCQQRDKEYYKRNREVRIRQARDWATNNPEKRKDIMRRVGNRLSKCPKHRIKSAMSAHINLSLRKGKQGQRWESLVGYSREQLMAHLEKQFSKGMSWSNYGEWHIDHITPISFFDYNDVNDDAFKACWSLTNLRPLWAKENISKGNKVVFLI